MKDQILKAIKVATKAHNGQLRKYTNEPYITHPFAVAGLVSSVTVNTDMIASAILHDVVEDTDVELKFIYNAFGSKISGMVEDLTDISKLEDGNRKVRKEIDRQHIAEASENSQTIKLADLVDNSKTIVPLDQGFARIYMAEKRELLKVLKKGDTFLWNLANSIVVNYYAQDESIR